MADDLDKSRRYGEITDVNPTPSIRASSNGWHSDFQAEQSQVVDEPPPHAHLHLNMTQDTSHKPSNQLHRIQRESSSFNESGSIATKELDGELSGLQAAAAKTALVVDGKVVREKPLHGVVTFEEDDEDGKDQSYHWIFHKHVGFSSNTKHLPPNYHGHHHLSLDSDAHSTEGSSTPNQEVVTADTLSTYQNEKNHLIKQLASLRSQRNHVQRNETTQLHRHLNEWNYRLSSAQQSHSKALSTLEEVSRQRICSEEENQQTSKWHVLGDVFFIHHRGPFGTINGVRLGRSAIAAVGLVTKCAGKGGSGSGARGNATTSSESAGPVSPASNGVSSFFSWGNVDNASSDNKNVKAQLNDAQPGNTKRNIINRQTTSPERVVVPWNEINSALGQIVLLLYTLRHTPHGGIDFTKHILQPIGSSSKIGFLKKHATSNKATSTSPHVTERRRITALSAYYTPDTSGQTAAHEKITSSTQALPPHEVTWYNLFHYEENGSVLSMGYYARRNFNAALEGLLYCIAEACLVVEKRDMALAAPYVMSVSGLVVGKDVHGTGIVVGSTKHGGSGSGEATIGGLPLSYDPADGERWTTICKYILTNLKWLIAYAAKHVDR